MSKLHRLASAGLNPYVPHQFLRWRHWTQIGRSAKLVRDARRHCQSGSDRLEKRPTDPATAGRKHAYFRDWTL